MDYLPLPPKPNVLGPVDTAFFYAETPTNPMNLGALTILDGRMDFDKFVRFIDARVAQVPAYLQRLVQAPFRLGPPTWVFDTKFYIGNHVFRHTLPEGGTERDLQELVGHIISRALSKDKPLWEIHMVAGLSDNRTAVLFKVHHCMVDGLAAIDLFTMLMDFSPDYKSPGPKPPYTPPDMPNTASLLRDAFIFDVPTKLDVAQRVREEVGILAEVIKDPAKRRKAFVGLAYLASDSTKMIRKLAINGKNTGRQILASAEFPLDDVKLIRKTKGASINDVMLSVLAGAVRSYVGPRGDRLDADFVRMLVPVNMRVPGTETGVGNRISLVPIDIPLHIEDPLERLATVTDFTTHIKESALSNTLDLALTLPALLPSTVQPLVWKVAPQIFSMLAHTWCTNVAGPPVPVYILGHELKQVFGFFPLNPNMGMACVIASYNNKITMTAVMDKGIMPDYTAFQQAIKDTYQALWNATRKQMGVKVEVEATKNIKFEVMSPPPARPKSDPYPAELDSDVVKQADVPVSPVKRPLEVEHPDPEGEPEALPIEIEPRPPVDHSGQESSAAPAYANGTQQNALREAVQVEPHRPFTEPWAAAYRDALNGNMSYYAASTRWEAGPVALVTLPDGRNIDSVTAVLLDLHKGKCRSARVVPVATAMQDAAFVIEGEYATWLEVLAGRTAPLSAITRGRLRLKKGAITRLLPFTKSAAELVKTAQLI